MMGLNTLDLNSKKEHTMFLHPLINDLSAANDADIEKTIYDLTNKYTSASRSRNFDLCSQILIVLEDYKAEQTKRMIERSKVSIKNSNKDLGDLIKVS